MTRKYDSFVATLNHVPLRIVCARESEYPEFSKSKEQYLHQVFREFSRSDEIISHEANRRRSKGEKMQEAVKDYRVVSIYDAEADEIVRFYQDHKPPKFEQVVEEMSVENLHIIKASTVQEAVIVMRVPITEMTDLWDVMLRAKKFSPQIGAYLENDEPVIEDQIDKDLLKANCEVGNVPFPKKLFERVKSLRRYVSPKYKPGE